MKTLCRNFSSPVVIEKNSNPIEITCSTIECSFISSDSKKVAVLSSYLLFIVWKMTVLNIKFKCCIIEFKVSWEKLL